jgi:hypothetical protein
MTQVEIYFYEKLLLGREHNPHAVHAKEFKKQRKVKLFSMIRNILKKFL